MTVRFITGCALEQLQRLPSGCAQMFVTSPSYYGVRDYGMPGQIGLEASPAEYVHKLVGVFREARRVLRDDGVLWLNLGDTYHSPRYPTGVGANSTINGTDHQEEFRRAKLVIREASRAGVNGFSKDSPAGDVAGPPHRAAPVHGFKPKDLMGMPWRVAFALQDDGWTLRQDVIWHKPNPKPENVGDRCTKAHEYLFLFSKSELYYFDADAISEPVLKPRAMGNKRHKHETEYARASGLGDHSMRTSAGLMATADVVRDRRIKRSVWTIATEPFREAHFAVMPKALVEPCVLAGSRPGDLVVDPFGGAGTVGVVADDLSRNALLIDLNPRYVAMAERRLSREQFRRDERESYPEPEEEEVT
jgi:DNA modification methylase